MQKFLSSMFNEYDGDYAGVTDKDNKVIVSNFEKDIDMYIDECGRIFDNCNWHIADVKITIKDDIKVENIYRIKNPIILYKNVDGNPTGEIFKIHLKKDTIIKSESRYIDIFTEKYLNGYIDNNNVCILEESDRQGDWITYKIIYNASWYNGGPIITYVLQDLTNNYQNKFQSFAILSCNLIPLIDGKEVKGWDSEGNPYVDNIKRSRKDIIWNTEKIGGNKND